MDEFVEGLMDVGWVDKWIGGRIDGWRERLMVG
jgi:hypothetical protein